MQRRQAALVAGHDVGAPGNQQLEHIGVALQYRENQRRFTSIVLRVDLGPLADQRAHLLKITRPRGVMERSGERAASKEYK
jgi:hypothetical protein